MNLRFAGVMAFYAYLTMKLGPEYFGTPNGYVIGALGSYALYETVGKQFIGY